MQNIIREVEETLDEDLTVEYVVFSGANPTLTLPWLLLFLKRMLRAQSVQRINEDHPQFQGVHHDRTGGGPDRHCKSSQYSSCYALFACRHLIFLVAAQRRDWGQRR